MTRLFQIAVFSCAGLLLTGCNSSETSAVVGRGMSPRAVREKSEPIWQNVKITDLAPSHSDKRPGDQSLETINFDVYTFEIPAENTRALNVARQMLYTKPLRFNDYDAFGANSFLAGFGQIQMWNKIADLLRAADGKKTMMVSLLLSDGQADDIAIAAFDNEQTIFYISGTGSMEGATIGPGTLALRLKAEKIPASRGVCNVSALPVFSPPISSSIPQLAAREKSGELLFTCCRFELKMSPGDFVLLWPEKYISDQITLAGLFFSRPELVAGGDLQEGWAESGRTEQKPSVRAYLIVCTRIND